jgi:hypothetical protein
VGNSCTWRPDTNADTDTDSNAYADTYANSDTDGNSDSDANSDTNTNTDTNTDSNTDADADTDSNTDSDANTNAFGHLHADVDDYGDSSGRIGGLYRDNSRGELGYGRCGRLRKRFAGLLAGQCDERDGDDTCIHAGNV